MNGELFSEATPAKQETKRAPRKIGTKDVRPDVVYTASTLQEIMEFFDWGFIFPPGHLYQLLNENEILTRFKDVPKHYFMTFYRSPRSVREGEYQLEFDLADLEGLLDRTPNDLCGQWPIPAHMVRQVVCSNERDQEIFRRAWAKSDNDPLPSSVIRNVGVANERVINCKAENKEVVLQLMQQLDHCLGAICFTKDLDPFTKYQLMMSAEEAAKFRSLTFSNSFLHVLHAWMPLKTKKQLGALIAGDRVVEAKYLEFIERLVTKDWEADTKNGILLKALFEGDDGSEVIELALKGIEGQGNVALSEKLRRTLKGVTVGVIDIKKVIQDPETRRPGILFLVLLQLFHRRGKIETDARSYRDFLFDKELDLAPAQIEFLGALYGYYIGYHRLRKLDTLSVLAGYPIQDDPEVHDLFRQKLSSQEPFEKAAFNILYNHIAKQIPGAPQLPVDVKVVKEKRQQIIKELAGASGRRQLIFDPVSQLGKHAYEVRLVDPPSIDPSRVVSLVSKFSQDRAKRTTAYFLIRIFLKEQVAQTGLAKDIVFSFRKDQVELDLEIDLDRLSQSVLSTAESTPSHAAFQDRYTELCEMLEKLSTL